MVSRLFPAVEKEMNLVSGGNRYRVETLHRTLERSVEEGNIPIKIYSVVDKDAGTHLDDRQEYSRHYSWDVYHIENYLLEAQYIGEALKDLNVVHEDTSSMVKIDQCLTRIAKTQIGKLVSHKVSSEIDSELVRELKLSANPMSSDIGADIHRSMVGSLERMSNHITTELGIDQRMRKKVTEETDKLEKSLQDGTWKSHFRGRDILRAFVGQYVPGMGYEYFRDLSLVKWLTLVTSLRG